MSDLIDRQAAIKAIDDLPNCYNGYSDTYDKAYIIGVLEELPTADAVEVVRCKDCEYWRGEGKYCDYDMSGLSDDYCSWGVRRAKDEDSKKG